MLLPWDPVGVGVTPDGSRAVVNGSRGIAVVDLALGDVVAPPRERASLSSPDGVVRIAPDGRTAAVLRNAEVLLLDVATQEVLATRDLGSRSATAAAGHRPRMGGR